jgi:hypothetical protein
VPAARVEYLYTRRPDDQHTAVSDGEIDDLAAGMSRRRSPWRTRERALSLTLKKPDGGKPRDALFRGTRFPG